MVESRNAVTVRYWGGARAAAGVDSEQIEAASVTDALTVVTGRRPAAAGFAAVLQRCSVLVDGQGRARARWDDPLPPGATVELLPPFAGGAV